MRHVFVFDTKYFSEQQWKINSIFDNIGQFFRTQVRPEFTTHTPRYPRESLGIIQEQADKAKDGDTIRVYAIGGEEIFFDCLNGIAGLRNTELAIVTSGNTNDFMRIFGVAKADLSKDIQSLASSPAIPTDLISVDNWYVLNGCFVGYAAAEAKKRKDFGLNKKTDGLSALIRLLLVFLVKLATVFNKKITARHYTITIDGKDFSGDYSHISIVNGPYYGGNKTAAPGALPNDGLLDVALLKSASPLSTLLSVNKFSRGKMPANGAALQAKKITIQSDEPVWIQMDGEFIQDTSVTFEVLPKAVQIVTANNVTYETHKDLTHGK